MPVAGHIPLLEQDSPVSEAKVVRGWEWNAAWSCGWSGGKALTHGQARLAISKHMAHVERAVGLR